LIFDGFQDLDECIDILIFMLGGIKIRRNITENPAYNSIFSTEEVNRLVKTGIPFRDAYKAVSGMIKHTSFSRTLLSDYTHEGSIGNLCNNEIAAIAETTMKNFNAPAATELAEKMLKYVL
jgi:argininosuccinate lyase